VNWRTWRDRMLRTSEEFDLIDAFRKLTARDRETVRGIAQRLIDVEEARRAKRKAKPMRPPQPRGRRPANQLGGPT